MRGPFLKRAPQPAAGRPDTTSAFTLIEVLVVVAIIALLVAILLPSLSRAREQSRVIACGSNIRITGTAMFYYTEANGDFYPSSGAWAEHVRPYIQEGGRSIFKGREDYYKTGVDYDVAVFSCPSDRFRAPTGEMKKLIDGKVVSMNHLVSYVINIHVCWPLADPEAARSRCDYSIIPESKRAVGRDDLGNAIWANMQKASDIKRPSEIITFADGGDDEVSVFSANWDFDDDWDYEGPVLEVHHRNGNNFVFGDQHVEYRKVLGSSVPRRGVPAVPRHWIPISGLTAESP